MVSMANTSSISPQAQEVLFRVYVGQNVNRSGILQSQIKEKKETQALLSEGLIKENHWYLDQFLTTTKGSEIGKSLVKTRIEKNNERLQTRARAMFENKEFFGSSFSEFVIPLFEQQKTHKVLFLTKIANVSNIVRIPDHRQTIMSFSLNPPEVAQIANEPRNVPQRIKSARQVYECGYETRIRIDPMIPISNWRKHYGGLLDDIFDAFAPHRITIGSLRINNPRLPDLRPRFWNMWKPKMTHLGQGIYRFPMPLDRKMYSWIIELLIKKGYDGDIALCKELRQVWEDLDLDYNECKCNCLL